MWDETWTIDQLCKEFGKSPLEIRYELEHDPRQEMLEIMTLRTYARTKAAIDTATDQAAAARLPLAEWVFDHIAEIVQERSRG